MSLNKIITPTPTGLSDAFKPYYALVAGSIATGLPVEIYKQLIEFATTEELEAPIDMQFLINKYPEAFI